MIRLAGHGVAMPSAPAEVLAAARYVAPPVEEEGAAAMIERLVLGRAA
jgi:hydroxymethylpyrimidine pyrophosphatase-like HAD family hydrolase